MTTYTPLTDSTLKLDKPVTELVGRAGMRDNLLAVLEGDASAPHAAPAALAMPYFMATRTTDFTLSTSSATKVQFNTEVYDPSSLYDNSTNYRFTPNKAGIYLVGVRVFLSTLSATPTLSPGVSYGSYPTSGLSAGIFKNGSAFMTARTGPTSSTINGGATTILDGKYMSAECTAIVQMNGTTDYVEGYVQDFVSSSFSPGNSYQGAFWAIALGRL